ncbi:Zinc finger protein 73, partial [Ophiophagus hannah]
MAKRLASTPVTFEDVVVYFTAAEWVHLTNWQRDFYQAVMMETYELVASVAGDGVPMAEDEEGGVERPVWQYIPRGKRRRKTPQPRADTAMRQSKPAASKLDTGYLPRVMQKLNPPKCPECDKTFLTNVALTIHIRTHTGERPFECHLCSRAFPAQSDLTRHLKTHLRRKDPPDAGTLPQATEFLAAKLQLLRQLGVSSGPVKLHGCARCESNSEALALRKACEMQEKPYRCPKCEKRFRDKNIMQAHLQTHGKREGLWVMCVTAGGQARVEMEHYPKVEVSQKLPREVGQRRLQLSGHYATSVVPICCAWLPRPSGHQKKTCSGPRNPLKSPFPNL